jgi:hypothetical protein
MVAALQRLDAARWLTDCWSRVPDLEAKFPSQTFAHAASQHLFKGMAKSSLWQTGHAGSGEGGVVAEIRSSE